MANYCINKSLPVYKELLKILGDENKIITLFIANRYVLPSIAQAEKFKKSFDDLATATENPNIVDKLETLIEGKRDYKSNKIRQISKVKAEYRDLKKKIIDKKKDISTNNSLIKLQKQITSLDLELVALQNDIDDLHLVDKRDKVVEFANNDLIKLETILEKDNIDAGDVREAQAIIHNWNIVLDLDSSPLFEEDDLVDPGEYLKSLQQAMSNLQGEFKLKEKKFTSIAGDIYKKMPTDLLKMTLSDTLKEYMGSLQEIGDKGGIGAMSAHVFGISESKELAFQILHQTYKERISQFNLEFDDLNTVIDEVFKDFTLEEKNLFKQKASNKDNREVSSLTDISTYEYKFKLMEFMSNYSTRANKIKTNIEIKDNERGKLLSNLAKQTIADISNISIALNPKYFFEMTEEDARILGEDAKYTAEDKIEHENMMRDLLNNNTTLFNRYKRQMEEMVTTYKTGLKYLKFELESKFPEDFASQARFLNEYIADNSPFIQSNNFIKNKIQLQSLRGSLLNGEKLLLLPAKTDKKGNSLDYYDNDFKKIMSNEKLTNAYFFTHEVYEQAQSIIPRDQIKGTHMLTMFPFERGFLETIAAYGVKGGLKPVADKMRMAFSSKANKKIPNVAYQKTQLEGLNNPFEFMSQYIKVETEKFKKENKGEEPTFQQRNEWRIQYLDKISKNNTSDLSKIIQSHAGAMLMFKHKASIEDSSLMLYNYINDIIAVKLKTASKTSNNDKAALNPSKLQAELDRLNYTMASLLGYHPKQKTSTKKSLSVQVTSENKVAYNELKGALKELDEQLSSGKIDKIKHYKESESIKQAMASMEYNVDHVTILDGLNTYIRMKSMGWNIFSSTANVGFGIIANTLMGSDGRNFNMKDLMFGYKIITHSIANSLTFNGLQSKLAEKLSNVMRVNDILKKSRYEVIEKKSTKRGASKLEAFGPWNLLERGEYINQGPIVIAGLKHAKVTYKGEETDLWEIIEKNGHLPLDASQEIQDLFIQTKVSMEAYIRRAHGNYDAETPLLANKEITNRLLKTFKTWMPQAFLTRFGDERPSLATNTVEKGRYISAIDAVKYGIGGRSSVQTAGFIAKQAIKKLWSNTGFDYYYNVHNREETLSIEDYNKLNEADKNNFQLAMSTVDAASMRSNLTELYWAFSLTTMTALLSLMVSSMFDDDEDEYKKSAAKFWINIVGRVQSDINMWFSPVEFKNILKDPIALTGIITDMYKAVDASIAVSFGDKPLLIESGSYKDENRLTRAWFPLILGANSFQKATSIGKSVYKNDNNFWYNRLSSFTEDEEK